MGIDWFHTENRYTQGLKFVFQGIQDSAVIPDPLTLGGEIIVTHVCPTSKPLEDKDRGLYASFETY